MEKEKIMTRLQEHLERAMLKYPYDNIVGIFLQGSQNYNLDYEDSDIDSKVIVVPSFNDIVLNKRPASETLLMENDEHVDVKDIRLMFTCFKKQNVNFVEILFTPYFILNPKYEIAFSQNVLNFKNDIARYDRYAAVSCIKGMTGEKFNALKHPYPTILDKISKFGYDPKQLHHMMRMEEFLDRYINGEPYADCLISKQKEYLMQIKKGILSEPAATQIAQSVLNAVKFMADTFRSEHPQTQLCSVNDNLDKAIVEIFKISLGIE